MCECVKLYVSGWLDSIVLPNEVKVISRSSYGRILSTLYLRGQWSLFVLYT